MKKFLVIFAAAVMLAGCAGESRSQQPVRKEITCLEDMEGSRVLIMTGSLYDLALSGNDRMDLLRFSGFPDMVAALRSGQGDYMFMDDASLIAMDIEGNGLEVVWTSDFVSGDIGSAFRKSDAALCRSFNEFLAQVRADGTYDEICARWLNADDSSAVMPDFPELSGEPIIVGESPFFPFFYIKDAKPAGMEAELLLRFGQYIGRPIQIKILDFGALIAALSSGKIDMITSFMTINEERAKTVLFSDPYYYAATAVLAKAENSVADKLSFKERIVNSVKSNLIEEDRWKMILDGLWETLIISLFSILFGTLFGALLCWMRMSRNKVASGVAKVFVDIMRGLPLLVILMIMFYVIFASSRITARWVAIIAFAMNFGAYTSEMFRASILGVDKGQTEAGLAMGFGRFGTFFNFVLPQAVQSVQPVYKGEVISLIKNTSIVGYIAIQDLTKVSDIIRSRTFDAFCTLIVISIIYFVLAWLIGKLLDLIGKKL